MKLDGFEEVIKEAWVCDASIVDPFKRFNALLRNAGAYLQVWGQRKTGNIKLQMAVATWVIFRLDKALDRRQL